MTTEYRSRTRGRVYNSQKHTSTNGCADKDDCRGETQSKPLMFGCLLGNCTFSPTVPYIQNQKLLAKQQSQKQCFGAESKHLPLSQPPQIFRKFAAMRSRVTSAGSAGAKRTPKSTNRSFPPCTQTSSTIWVSQGVPSLYPSMLTHVTDLCFPAYVGEMISYFQSCNGTPWTTWCCSPTALQVRFTRVDHTKTPLIKERDQVLLGLWSCRVYKYNIYTHTISP